MPSGMRGEVLRGSTLVSRSPHRNAVPSGGHFLPPRSRTHVPPRRPAPSQRPGASLRPGDRRTLSVHRIHHLSICTRQCQGCAPRAGVVCWKKQRPAHPARLHRRIAYEKISFAPARVRAGAGAAVRLRQKGRGGADPRAGDTADADGRHRRRGHVLQALFSERRG